MLLSIAVTIGRTSSFAAAALANFNSIVESVSIRRGLVSHLIKRR
jgi:hypothetical protein